MDGQALGPIEPGPASLAIDATGAATMGVWGEGFPVPGTQVVSVRQNLPPLVTGGQPSPAASAWPARGATLGGGSVVARSALGEDAAAALLYGASMSALPIDLAQALAGAGAFVGMELDINRPGCRPMWQPSQVLRWWPRSPASTGRPASTRWGGQATS